MMRFFLSLFLLFTLLVPQSLFAQAALQEDFIFDPNLLASDEQMLDTYSTTKTEVAFWLEQGSLAQLQTTDVHGSTRSALDIIWNASQEFGINPRFLLVLLQREQSLVEDDHPTQDQLDWAMGYAVCDDCAKSDPRIQKFKGFGNQVHYAAKRIRESYLDDLDTRGFTETGLGPGIATTIDGIAVIPANRATAVLYTYTPHLHGNKNFVRIWGRWFDARHVDGSLLQDKTTGGIWLIQNGQRRPIASKAAFYSRFHPQNIIQVGPSLIEQYPMGNPIRFPNYSLLRSPGGTVYLIVDDERRGFTSQEAFRALGFSSDEIVDAGWDDLNLYQESEPITTQTVYPQGALLQDQSSGGVYFVRNGVKQPIMSREILSAHFQKPTIIPMKTDDLHAYETGDPLPFPDGTLIAAQGSPDVFIVTQGKRRPILDEATFLSFGWQWHQIVWTSERSVLLHPLGDPLQFDLVEEEPSIEITGL